MRTDRIVDTLSEFVDFLSDFYKEGFNLEWRNFVYQNKLPVSIPLRQTGTSSSVVTALQTLFKAKPIEWGTVLPNREYRLHSYLNEWTLRPSELRDKKIETILK